MGPYTSVWRKESVYARAVLELSPGALQRIARSLCAGLDAATETMWGKHKIIYQPVTGSAKTMMQWRMTSEQRAEAAE
jgi:hypothetical protein